MIFLDFDKAGAEWVIVAYLTGDPRMLDVIRRGISPHVVTGSLISRVPEELVERENKIVGKHTDPTLIDELRAQIPELRRGDFFIPRTMSIRQMGKKSNHGLNYDESYKTFALINEIDEVEARTIVSLYKTQAYPGLPAWHEEIREQLRKDRTLTNCFGYKRRFLDAWGPDLFRAAYAQLPQSTNVQMVNRGMRLGYADESPEFRRADLKAQVHDSLLWQYPERDLKACAAFSWKLAMDYMRPRCEYRGVEFFVETDLKVGVSWAEEALKEVKLIPDIDELAYHIKYAVDASRGITAKKAA